ncbi:MAG: hypothetical protein KDD64_07055 [Bdellovibrionales bacterium]|nr:hypothetical protein [Bdellovibrionales bacterium]
MDKMKWRNLLAVDPSLTCSGWALFRVEDQRLLAVGKIKSLPASLALADRLLDLQQKVGMILEKTSLETNDVLVCEAQTTMRDPRAAFTVEQVRGIFEALARERGVRVPGRINPRTVQSEVLGLRGAQLKRDIVKASAREVAWQLYGALFREFGLADGVDTLRAHQDVVDACLVGTSGVARISRSMLCEEPLETLFSQNARARQRATR